MKNLMRGLIINHNTQYIDKLVELFECDVMNHVDFYVGEVYSDRKKWKKVMMEKHTELENLKDELKKLEDTPL